MDNWGAIEGRMLLHSGAGLAGMSSRQALDIAFAWLTSRPPEEVELTKLVDKALLDTNSIADNASLSDIEDATIDALLDSL